MSFRRSNSGLSNYKHFKSIDYQVYVEGKSDLSYWETLFQIFRSDLKLQFQRVNGVDNLSDITENVIRGNIRNVIICRDADYNRVLEKINEHKNIISTYGYSFENDFITGVAAEKVVALLCPQPVRKGLARRAFDKYLRDLSIVGEWLLKMDISYSASKNNVIVRTNPRHLMTEKTGIHHFSPREIAGRVQGLDASKPRKRLDFLPYSPVYPRYYCGHSMFFIFVTWCKSFVRRIFSSVTNASDNLLKNFLLSHYREVANPAAVSHIEQALKAVGS